MLVKCLFSKIIRQKKQIKITFVLPLEESDFPFETLEGFKGYLKFQGKPITKQIEEAMENKHLAPDINGKTKSQILRGEFFTLWSIEDGKSDPSQYYSDKMDTIIEHIRKKIEKHNNGN